VHLALRRQDIRVSRKRIIRLMQGQGSSLERGAGTAGTTMSDHEQPVAANLLGREFTAVSPAA
jgi:hypothetical protein